jgi:nucleotide-binding universal stress UspA family protein
MTNVRTLRGADADLRVAAKSVRDAVSPVARIVVPVQGSDREYQAQTWGVQLAASLGCPLRAVHVASALGADDRIVFRFLRKQAREWGVPLETTVISSGDPAEEVLAELRANDLVVIGTRQLGGRYHLGSLAEQLIRRAPCPVQVLRLPGRSSAVP